MHDADEVRSDQPGLVIGGRYLMKEQLGSGGMGSVWRAEHLMLKREVAVKFLEVRARGTSIAERFLREARISGRIRHRHVVQVLDFGTAPDGRPYMVMELLEGRSMSDWIASTGSVPMIEAVRMMARVLAGLGAVHDAGIVHRDVKPDNVVLVSEDGRETPKLIDFGISKVVTVAEGVRSVVDSAENIIIGTPAYMSPEQARGVSDLDARSDVYSAAAVFYELLAGFPPHVGELPGDVIHLLLSTDPAPLRQVRPDLPEGLAEVIARAMSRDRDLRYPDGNAFRRALIAVVQELEGEVTGRRSVATDESLRPPPRPAAPTLVAPVAALVDRQEASASVPSRVRKAWIATAMVILLTAVVIVVVTSRAEPSEHASGSGAPLAERQVAEPQPAPPSASPVTAEVGAGPSIVTPARTPMPESAVDAPRARPRPRRAAGLVRNPGF